MDRKKIRDSIRWAVFHRDGFCCRYCGVSAGTEGVALVVDHVISVADGGTNAVENLVTACRKCNGGKSARSLEGVPAPQAVVDRVNDRAKSLADLSAAMREEEEARKEIEQTIVNIKCRAYGVKTTTFVLGEMPAMFRFVRIHGSDKLSEWYQASAARCIPQSRAVQYVCGCARRHAERVKAGLV